MTEYFESVDGDTVTNPLNTHGIIPDDYTNGEIEWQTGVSPSLLLDVAKLVEFCYRDTRTVDVGLVGKPEEPDAAPAIVIGDAHEDDRYIMLAAKQDCAAGSRGGSE